MMNLPAIVLPSEFLTLLKSPAPTGGTLSSVLRSSPGLSMVLERAFHEFDEHRLGLEKVMNLLGWAHFRDRMASVYVFKALHGSFPAKTDMDLAGEVHDFEARFYALAPNGNSRLFMLGFYLKLMNVRLMQSEGGAGEVVLPASLEKVLALRQVRTERPDWLVLLVWHMDRFLGTEKLIEAIGAGVAWSELYRRLGEGQRFQLTANLLSYGASIQEEDPFLYERI